MIILYGSETGTSQDIAERIWRESKLLGLECRLSAMDDYDMKELIDEAVAVFVVSTTGQGDTPSNMKKSWKFLLRKSLPKNSLSNIRIAVLGLGDSSYTCFNFVAKKLYKRLCVGLSAKPLVELGLSDEQHDLGQDAVIEPWTVNLWNSFAKLYPGKLEGKLPLSKSAPIIFKWSVKQVNDEQAKPISMTFDSNELMKYKVELSSNLRTTPKEHFQEVRLLKFQALGGVKFVYNPGDVALIFPENSDASVNQLFSLFNSENRKTKLDKKTIIRLEKLHKDVKIPNALVHAFTLFDCAKWFWDLNAIPRRYVFQVMARVTENELEREKLEEMTTSDGQEELYNYCNRPRRTVLEVLYDFPHVVASLQLEHLFEIFQPIRPRYFSIASSPLVHDSLELLVAVVRYRTKLFAPRIGLCSNWMSTLEIGTKLNIAIKRGSLQFPTKNDLPVVMVGPGTGIAPFRSFALTEIVENKQYRELRELVIVFGCRNMKADFHFKEDLNKDEIQLFTAFSRDQPHKIYVQHVIDENRNFFFDVIFKRKGYFFIAGNSQMPQPVRESLIKCLMLEGMLSEEEANNFITDMEHKKLYQTETWS